MKNKIIAAIMLVSIVVTGCGKATLSETASDTSTEAETPATEETSEAVNDETTEYPIKNEDGSYTYPFTFPDEYISTDFAGIDVLESTEDYPRERFEDVFLYSKGSYLNDPSVPAEFFDEWGYSCAAADCKDEGDDPGFGFSCTYIKDIDGKVSFMLIDKNYALAVRWEKGQIEYNLWDNEMAIVLDKRRGLEDASISATKEIMAHNELMGANAKEFMDSFDEGFYDFVLSTFPSYTEDVRAYSPLFYFDNGVMRACNISEDGTIGFEFMFPEKGRKVYEITVDTITGKVYGSLYRTPYPGENFYSYPAGNGWDENGLIELEDAHKEYPQIDVPDNSEDAAAVAESTEEKPTEEKTSDEKPAASTGVVIDEEEFTRGVMMSPKRGVAVNDEFATGVKSSLVAQLEGMGASEGSDPSALIYRSIPIRLGTSPEEAANTVINDVMPMFNFDFNGKNFYISSIEKFDNGYVVMVGWTRWN